MKFFYSHTQAKSRGFSFGEVLLAAFVLSVGLLAVVKLFQVSTAKSFVLRDAIIASGLAQEGVELVRNVRDNDFVAGGTGFAAFSESNHHCYIAVNSTNLNCYANQGNTAQYNLNYNAAYQNGKYVANATNRKFKRYIYIQYTANPEPSATVKSFVTWDGSLPSPSGSTSGCSIENKCVYTEMYLTNWKT